MFLGFLEFNIPGFLSAKARDVLGELQLAHLDLAVGAVHYPHASAKQMGTGPLNKWGCHMKTNVQAIQILVSARFDACSYQNLRNFRWI